MRDLSFASLRQRFTHSSPGGARPVRRIPGDSIAHCIFGACDASGADQPLAAPSASGIPSRNRATSANHLSTRVSSCPIPRRRPASSRAARGGESAAAGLYRPEAAFAAATARRRQAPAEFAERASRSASAIRPSEVALHGAAAPAVAQPPVEARAFFAFAAPGRSGLEPAALESPAWSVRVMRSQREARRRRSPKRAPIGSEKSCASRFSMVLPRASAMAVHPL